MKPSRESEISTRFLATQSRITVKLRSSQLSKALSNFGQLTDGLYCRNHKILLQIPLLQQLTALQISLTPLRQLIQIIFCGWSTASAIKRCIKMAASQGLLQQAAHLWIATSILSPQFLPLSCYNIWCNSHNNNQLSGCPETERWYLWCSVGRRRCVLSSCGNSASEAKWV